MACIGFLMVLVLTLWPSNDTATESFSRYCVICGNRGFADAILNTLLFIPFGAGLTVLFSSTVAVLGSALLSAGVELAQSGLVGRHPTLGDLLFNTLGGGCGVFLVHLAKTLPKAVRHPSTKLTISALLAPLGVFFVSAALVSPRYPSTEYYGQWTHELGHLIPYPGEVLSASVGEAPLPDGMSQDSKALRGALEAGEPILVSFVVAPHTPKEAHLLAVFDEAQTEIFLVTVLGRDLRFQWRSWSTVILLDRPFVQWEGVVPDTPRDTANLGIWQEGSTLCLEVGRIRRCTMAGVEQNWRLFFRASSAPPWLLAVLSAVWVVFLCIPAGAVLPAALTKGAFLGVGLGGFAAAISWWSPFMNPHLVTFMAPLVGVLAGALIRQNLLNKRSSP